ncbi:hypothetical protein DBR06_SOUSAS27710020 [Sousa chinensis]|uniref:Large ribosomal subunit protein mL48 n=1 Tax=Sousa chinensis TaxID=103600 RepID=A0A484GKY4_SOUCH|nr:hypothetical protein DBR06_SOUSAS27710020 [Sousa chinensis]
MCEGPEMRTRLEFQRAQRKLEGREARELVSRESVRRSSEPQERIPSVLQMFRMGMTGPVSWVANLSFAAELSPFLGAEVFLRILCAGWLNHVATRRCQFLWKWGFRIISLRLGAMAAADWPGEQGGRGATGILLSISRHYRSQPTHGIGRYKHLVKAQEPKKKRGKVEVRPINLGTDYEYGVLNIHLIAYDMALAESYAQYVHNLCNHLSIKVEESYAMPTKTVEVLQLQDQGRKMLLDSVLTTHERVISGLSATFAEIFLEIIQSNLPEGVKLSVKEHTEEDFKGRFKARPELEELLAKLN